MDPKKERPDRRDTPVSDDTVLKIAKEIAVKFIEVGRLTPSTFDETFKAIHTTIAETVDKGD
ncbi:MAG: hypothetical protein V2J11_04085 [Desulfofustis sp.]|jgi:hypothetical protein|nr:hypothetical protein [Desulfofustis sp.]